MSTCISRAGEYSDHEAGDWCPRCGEFNEAAILAQRDALRAENASLRQGAQVLRGWITEHEETIMEMSDDLDEARQTARDVLALHREGGEVLGYDAEGVLDYIPACVECDQAWPCATVRALNRAPHRHHPEGDRH